jgi:hypothetical protein
METGETMTDKSNAARQKEYRERKRKAGLSKINLYVPTPYKDEIIFVFKDIILSYVGDGLNALQKKDLEMTDIKMIVPEKYSERIKAMAEKLIEPGIPENRTRLHVFETAERIIARGDVCKVWRGRDGWHVMKID